MAPPRVRKVSEKRTYQAWRDMIRRCFDPTTIYYADYGGRGITVDPVFFKFDAFVKELGECPEAMMLDRIENGKGYVPGNLRWTTRTVQNRNTRRNFYVTHDGLTLALSEWAEKTGIKYSVLHRRIVSSKWPPERAFTEPSTIVRSKLTAEQLQDILTSTDSQTVIGKRNGINGGMVSTIRSGKRLSALTGIQKPPGYKS